MPVLYASVADLKLTLQGTDDGTGTAAKLSDAQLTLALQAASSRISVFFGSIMDGSNDNASPPPVFHDLALDLAAFWAYKTYLKNKAMPNTHPVYLAYQNASQMLEDVRDGKLRLDPAPAGGINQQVGLVLNRIPPVFTSYDSNTQIDRMTGALESGTPYDMWSPRNDWPLSAGPVYQG